MSDIFGEKLATELKSENYKNKKYIYYLIELLRSVNSNKNSNIIIEKTNDGKYNIYLKEIKSS